jgi:tetratricopeptide (TPR) repeat protein
LEEAQGMLKHSLACLRQGADPAALVDALGVWCSACWLSGEFEEGARSAREAYALACRLHRRWQAATDATLVGALEHELGHYAEAYRWLSEGLAIDLSVGDPRAISFGTGLLSRTAQALGRSVETAALSRQALELTRATGDRFMIALSLGNLAQMATDPSEARRLYEESIALYREFGDQWSLTRALITYGYACAAWGDEAQAGQHFLEALNIALTAQLQVAVLDALIAIAGWKASQEIDGASLTIVTHVLQHPAATHDARARAERLRAVLVAQLTPEQVGAAEDGSAFEYHDAIVALALA